MAWLPHICSLEIWAMEIFDLKRDRAGNRGATQSTFLSWKSTDVLTELNYEPNEWTWMSPLFLAITSQNLKVHKVRRLLCSSSVWDVDITEHAQCWERERKEGLTDSNTSSHYLSDDALTCNDFLNHHCFFFKKMLHKKPQLLTNFDLYFIFFLKSYALHRSFWLLQICFPYLYSIDWHYNAIITNK